MINENKKKKPENTVVINFFYIFTPKNTLNNSHEKTNVASSIEACLPACQPWPADTSRTLPTPAVDAAAIVVTKPLKKLSVV